MLRCAKRTNLPLFVRRRGGLRAGCCSATIGVNHRCRVALSATQYALAVGVLLGDLVAVGVYALGERSFVIGSRRNGGGCRCRARYANRWRRSGRRWSWRVDLG